VPDTRDDYLIRLEQGQPITFGNDAGQGIRRGASGSLEVCDATDPGVLVHDAQAADASTAFALSRITRPDLSLTPIGVFRDIDRPVYDDLMNDQLVQATAKNGPRRTGCTHRRRRHLDHPLSEQRITI
jgi:2-oxoglutarate/2-oxoacid ferredoxin oxidoreductase subunit beta